MHNHNNKSTTWMMFLMVVCCLAPFLILLVGAATGITWWLLGLVAFSIGFHFFMMKRGHLHNPTHKEEDT